MARRWSLTCFCRLLLCGNVHMCRILFFHPRCPFLKISLHQSIFMFPLSFSSSSSLSSTAPSLDSISEFDHGLSDISEDDDLVVRASTSHNQAPPPSDMASDFCDQLRADLEPLLKSSLTSPAVTGSQTNASEALGVEERCQAETRATAGPAICQSWFPLRAVARWVSLFLCFLPLLGKNCYKCVTRRFHARVMKLSSCAATVSKLTSGHKSVGHFMMTLDRSPKLITSCDFRRIQNYVVFNLARLMAFLTSYVPLKYGSSVTAGLWKQSRLNWTCPPIVSSLSALPTKVFSVTLFSSLLPLHLPSASCLPATVHRYLRNPSPLFLPCLLILFLLVVMLTASHSLVLALILAAPLGLTLCYLEHLVSSQRSLPVLPIFASETPNHGQDDQLSSGFSVKTFPQKPKHSSPHIRRQVHKSANWTQEMCDPAA